MSSADALGRGVEGMLEHINVPSYVIDTHGVIRWTNEAARRIVGDATGRQFTSLVSPEWVPRARQLFAQKVVGNVAVTDSQVTLFGAEGERIDAEISSVPLVRGGHVVGVFGQVLHPAPATSAAHPALTPRQAEILRLLEHGRSTSQIADELRVSRETVRNHIRHMLKALGVHSRLEAVALARQAQPAAN